MSIQSLDRIIFFVLVNILLHLESENTQLLWKYSLILRITKRVCELQGFHCSQVPRRNLRTCWSKMLSCNLACAWFGTVQISNNPFLNILYVRYACNCWFHHRSVAIGLLVNLLMKLGRDSWWLLADHSRNLPFLLLFWSSVTFNYWFLFFSF